MSDSFKKILAACATGTTYITGIWGIDKWLVFTGLPVEQVVARTVIASLVAGLSLSGPFPIQVRSALRFMDVAEENRENFCIGQQKHKTMGCKIFTGLIRTLFSAASLSIVLYGLIGLGGTLPIIILLGGCYLTSQILTAHFGNQSHLANKSTYAEETTIQRWVRRGLMTLSGFAGVMSAGMSLLGLVALNYIASICTKSLEYCTLNPHLDHSKRDVLRVDFAWLMVFLIPMLRQGLMYSMLANDMFVWREHFNPDTAPWYQRFLHNFDENFLIPACATVIALGSSIGVSALLFMLLAELAKVNLQVSIGVSLSAAVLLGLVPIFYQKWTYLGYQPPEKPLVITLNESTEERKPLFARTEKSPSAWSRFKSCFWSCGKKDNTEDYSASESLKLLLV